MDEIGISNNFYNLGEDIREMRSDKGLTQGEFARQLGVTVVTINRIENHVAMPSWELLLRIAKLLSKKVKVTFVGKIHEIHDCRLD